MADSPVEAAEGANFVLTVLPATDTVAEVVGGEEGSDRRGEIAVEYGVAYVDAPVLGTKGACRAGAADRAGLRAGGGAGAVRTNL